jgi:hypothetical protein
MSLLRTGVNSPFQRVIVLPLQMHATQVWFTVAGFKDKLRLEA